MACLVTEGSSIGQGPTNRGEKGEVAKWKNKGLKSLYFSFLVTRFSFYPFPRAFLLVDGCRCDVSFLLIRLPRLKDLHRSIKLWILPQFSLFHFRSFFCLLVTFLFAGRLLIL